MKTAVSGEDAEGHLVDNQALVDFARHHGFHPFCALMLSCSRPQATARRAGCEAPGDPL